MTDDSELETIVEVARALKDESAITAAELLAATEAVRAAVCLVRTGKIPFDLDGKVVEEGNQEIREGQ